MELVVKNLPTKKTPGPDAFPTEFYQTFKDEIIIMIPSLSRKRKRENPSQRILHNQHYPDIERQRGYERRTVQTDVSHKRKEEHHFQNFSWLNPMIYKKDSMS